MVIMTTSPVSTLMLLLLLLLLTCLVRVALKRASSLPLLLLLPVPLVARTRAKSVQPPLHVLLHLVLTKATSLVQLLLLRQHVLVALKKAAPRKKIMEEHDHVKQPNDSNHPGIHQQHQQWAANPRLLLARMNSIHSSRRRSLV
jgi:hypothetical protein